MEGNRGIDFTFTLSKDEIVKLKEAFKPSQFEDIIRFEFESSGRVIASMFDQGVTIWVNLSTVDLNLRGEEYQFFYLDKQRVNKLSDAVGDKVTFNIKDEVLTCKIGSIDLTLSLPLYDAEFNIDFSPFDSEVKSSDDVKILCDRCFASKGKDVAQLCSMALKNKFYYGNSQSISIVDGGFESLDVTVDPLFLEYIYNLSFTKEEVKFSVDENKSYFMVSSSHVHYMTSVLDTPFNDLSNLFNQEIEGKLALKTKTGIDHLKILSIPLLGMDNTSFNFLLRNKDIEISVRDEGNRISKDYWDFIEDTSEGAIDCDLSISSFLNAVNVMSKEYLEIESKETALFLRDENQTTILVKYL